MQGDEGKVQSCVGLRLTFSKEFSCRIFYIFGRVHFPPGWRRLRNLETSVPENQGRHQQRNTFSFSYCKTILSVVLFRIYWELVLKCSFQTKVMIWLRVTQALRQDGNDICYDNVFL